MENKLKRQILVWVVVLGVSVSSLILVARFTTNQNESTPSAFAATSNYPNCRLGVGVTKNPITSYNYSSMNIGWYINWGTPIAPIKPGGIEYYFTVRVGQDTNGDVYLPTYHITPSLTMAGEGLGPIVQANPGQVWLIGNEIDRRGQNATMPATYATIYHDTYAFIKGIDPTARVAIGSIVEPTPLRLQYLDSILSAYRSQYATSMPIDVWNIHMYILPELLGSWGAEVPPGSTATQGMLYSAADNVKLSIFQSLVQNMRSWMQSRGYQDKPLIITEFGALLPVWWVGQFGVTQDNMNQFNRDTVNYMNTAVNSSLGYVGDSYRLVQRSALYSMDDDTYLGDGDYNWGTFLFNSTSPYTLTSIGQYYIGQIAASMTPTVDLYPYRAWTDPGSLIISMGNVVSPTFNVLVANAGNALTMGSNAAVSTTVRFVDVTGGANTLLAEPTLPPISGCGTTLEVSIIWQGLTPGLHQMRIEVDPGNLISETAKSNNVMTATVLVGTNGVYLPLIER